jgi:hypothetical protein
MPSTNRLDFRRLCRVFAVTLLALACASCSSKSSQTGVTKPVHPVRGKLFVAEKPAVGAFVLFIPVNEPPDSPVPRPRATVQEDGSFQLSTYGENDGAPVGDYRITVVWGVDGRDDEDRLQGRYADPDRSGLKHTVKEGPNEIPAFKLR